MTAISFAQVSQKYMTRTGETLALQDIDFQIADGELVGLVGPSGCGKSTVLSLIAGLLRPSSGAVHVFDQPVGGPRREIGYMLQQDYLLPWRTIGENIVLGLEIMGQDTSEKTDRARQLLHEMGLEGTFDRYPHQLSGGMRQRVALVRTLATDPRIILLDEPFSALDYQIKLQLEDLIVATLKQRALTGVLVTHDLGEAIAMCDRIFIMGQKPGHIKRVLAVPDSIRALPPLEARESAEYNALFRAVWGDLQDED